MTSRRSLVIAVTVAVLTVANSTTASYAHLSAQAADVKKRAKSIPGSAIVVQESNGQTRELRAGD